VQRSSHREDLDGCDELRQKYSFYMQAVK
jgi:hypothetical protein